MASQRRISIQSLSADKILKEIPAGSSSSRDKSNSGKPVKPSIAIASFKVAVESPFPKSKVKRQNSNCSTSSAISSGSHSSRRSKRGSRKSSKKMSSNSSRSDRSSSSNHSRDDQQSSVSPSDDTASGSCTATRRRSKRRGSTEPNVSISEIPSHTESHSNNGNRRSIPAKTSFSRSVRRLLMGQDDEDNQQDQPRVSASASTSTSTTGETRSAWGSSVRHILKGRETNKQERDENPDMDHSTSSSIISRRRSRREGESTNTHSQSNSIGNSMKNLLGSYSRPRGPNPSENEGPGPCHLGASVSELDYSVASMDNSARSGKQRRRNSMNAFDMLSSGGSARGIGSRRGNRRCRNASVNKFQLMQALNEQQQNQRFLPQDLGLTVAGDESMDETLPTSLSNLNDQKAFPPKSAAKQKGPDLDSLEQRSRRSIFNHQRTANDSFQGALSCSSFSNLAPMNDSLRGMDDSCQSLQGASLFRDNPNGQDLNSRSVTVLPMFQSQAPFARRGSINTATTNPRSMYMSNTFLDLEDDDSEHSLVLFQESTNSISAKK
jgi:hypothetical protein